MRVLSRFGSRFELSCTVSGRDLLQAGPPEFYELYLHYRTEEGDRLYAVPVRVLNYRKQGHYVNQVGWTPGCAFDRDSDRDRCQTVTVTGRFPGAAVANCVTGCGCDGRGPVLCVCDCG